MGDAADYVNEQIDAAQELDRRDREEQDALYERQINELCKNTKRTKPAHKPQTKG